MPLILLGLLVIIGLLVYMYFTGELGNFSPSKSKSSKKPSADKNDDDEPGKVIHLPSDIEKEKKKRHVKTGKD